MAGELFTGKFYKKQENDSFILELLGLIPWR